MMRVCKVCGEEKPDWDFEMYLDVLHGRCYYCYTCEECFVAGNCASWERILQSQNYKCKSCGEKLGAVIYIDRDDRTGVINGLFCHECIKGVT